MHASPAIRPAIPDSCTVVVAAPGIRCGKPAAVTFTSRSGDVFAECVEHDTSDRFAVTSYGVTVGDRVTVRVHGVDKIGTVEAVTSTVAYVLVPTYTGTRREDTRVVKVPIDDVRQVW